MTNMQEQILYCERKNYNNFYHKQLECFVVLGGLSIVSFIVIIAGINNTPNNLFGLLIIFLILLGLAALYLNHIKSDVLSFYPLKLTNLYIYLPKLDDNNKQQRIDWSEIIQIFLLYLDNKCKGILILNKNNIHKIIEIRHLSELDTIQRIIIKQSNMKFEIMNNEQYISLRKSIYT